MRDGRVRQGKGERTRASMTLFSWNHLTRPVKSHDGRRGRQNPRSAPKTPKKKGRQKKTKRKLAPFETWSRPADAELVQPWKPSLMAQGAASQLSRRVEKGARTQRKKKGKEKKRENAPALSKRPAHQPCRPHSRCWVERSSGTGLLFKTALHVQKVERKEPRQTKKRLAKGNSETVVSTYRLATGFGFRLLGRKARQGQRGRVVRKVGRVV